MKLFELVNRHPLCHLAVDDDNAKLLKFYNSSPMKGKGISLRYDRSPDFFDFLKCHSKAYFVFWFGDSDVVQGVGTVVIRPGVINGEEKQVGYLGDLRFNSNKRIALAWRKFYEDLLKSAPFIEEFNGCKHFLTAIIDENKAAINALMNRSKNSFVYVPKSPYEMINIFFKKPSIKIKRDKNIQVSIAKIEDLDSIKFFLKQHHPTKPFGYQVASSSHDELNFRLENWPDFSVENILIAKKNNEIVGVTCFWSPSRVKRVFIDRIPFFQNFLLKCLSPFISIPLNGKEFRILYLTFLTFDSPEVVCAFLRFIFQTKRNTSFHSVALCDFNQKSFKNSLDEFFYQSTPMTLYQVFSKEHVGDNLLFTTVPSFEMALV